MATRKCAAVVVGAGPAGVAVMGNLLERQLGSIAWIDPSFAAGRVHGKYREVPRYVFTRLRGQDDIKSAY
jgi:cation diffusion facilitator CzcD-associated flavoprotein CzcO